MIQGYFLGGIRKESEEYAQAIETLISNGLPQKILCDHELHEGFVRLSVASKKGIGDIHLVHNINVEGHMQQIQSPLTNEQCNALLNIYDMCASGSQFKQSVMENFIAKINEYSYWQKVREWWNAIPYTFQITVVGKVLAHSNAKRIDSTLPDMD